MIVFTMLMVCFTFKMLRRGQRLPIFYIIQIILVLSFFMTWWQLLKVLIDNKIGLIFTFIF